MDFIRLESINSGGSSLSGLNMDQRKCRSSTTIDNTLITLHVIEMNPPITPGEILLEEYLQPMGISQNAMARAIGVAPRAINEIVHGKRSITPQMSIRFGKFFNQSEDFWHGLQVECEFRALKKESSEITRYIQTAESLIVCEEEKGK